MGWLIALVVVVFIVWKINGNGKRRWKLTIAQTVAAMQPNLIAATMSPLVRKSPHKRTEIFLRVMANYAVAMAKGEQDMDSMYRDARNVLCIIHGDGELKRMLYDRYCETMESFRDGSKTSITLAFDEFSCVLADIRLR